MSTRLTFAPPPWVTALLLRPPPPPPATQPRTPPSAMRDLVAQWLVHVTDDTPTTTPQSPHVIARFRGWLAFVFRIPAFVRRQPVSETPQPQLPTPQFTLIERSLYFSSSIKDDDTATTREVAPVKEHTKKKKKKRGNNIDKVEQGFKLSPLYKSLYFSKAKEEEQVEHSVQPSNESPTIDITDTSVHSFFLTDATGEGKGILEGLREMKAQSAEPQRKRGWVPAVVSLILIALNPLK